LNELTKILSDKRRALRDEETKLHEIERKNRDKQFNETAIAERLKNEYEDLRGRFEQMAFELRFSIEDELRIYGRLLDELMKKSTVNSTSVITAQQGRSTGIEDPYVISTYQQMHSTSPSIGPGNTIFNFGSDSSIRPDLGTTTTNLGGSGSLFRSDDNDKYSTSSILRTSSYTKIN